METALENKALPVNKHNFSSSVAQGIKAVKANLAPGIILQICALCLLLSYYFIPQINSILGQLSEFKMICGVWFAAISTASFGAIIPFIIQYIFNPPKLREKIKYLPVVTIFWAAKGMEIELFYTLQARVFGDGNDLHTVLYKLIVDQLLYTPLWGLTSVTIFYIFKDCNFRPSRTWETLQVNFFYGKLLPQWLCGWSIWIPGVCIIYNLPTALQLPMQNILLCLQVLLIIFLSRKAVKETQSTEPADQFLE